MVSVFICLTLYIYIYKIHRIKFRNFKKFLNNFINISNIIFRFVKLRRIHFSELRNVRWNWDIRIREILKACKEQNTVVARASILCRYVSLDFSSRLCSSEWTCIYDTIRYRILRMLNFVRTIIENRHDTLLHEKYNNNRITFDLCDNTWKITIENSIVFDLLKEKSKKIT